MTTTATQPAVATTTSAAPLGGWGRGAFAAARANAERLDRTKIDAAMAMGRESRAMKEVSRTGVSQAEMLEAILREFPVWASRSMAVPHVMKFIKSCVDDGMCCLRYDLAAFTREVTAGGMSVLVLELSGVGADGEMDRRLDLGAIAGVLVEDGDRRFPGVKAAGPVTYTSEATARDFAGIEVPADARRHKGVCDATGSVPGIEAGVPGAAAPASAIASGDEGEE